MLAGAVGELGVVGEGFEIPGVDALDRTVGEEDGFIHRAEKVEHDVFFIDHGLGWFLGDRAENED